MNMNRILYSSVILGVCLLFFLSCHHNRESGSAQTGTGFLSDDSLLSLVEYNTFQYFWTGAEPVSGMAPERIHMDDDYPEKDKSVVTTGGTGFGLMAILVGIKRGFITRDEGYTRLNHIVGFLDSADRFHGVWPHWLYGESGKVKPFSRKDNGGDLVETAYLVQGLLCVRQFFSSGTEKEKALAADIDKLWRQVEWDWYRNGGKDVLYWHWSPEYGWEMNFPIEGYNECLITYILAASSPDHGIPPEVYHRGWARNGAIRADVSMYGHRLTLKHNGSEKYGGPLFWAHYSYLGLDPRGLKDPYAGFWEHNRNHVLINHAYCVENPKHCMGYGKDSWGLTASYSIEGYAAHSPAGDLCVISPTAALSSFPYTPEYSMEALKYFYYTLGDRAWGPYGFYDAFSEQENWFPPRYLAIDQGPVVVMIENYRTGLCWELFMSCPEIIHGLKTLGFTSPHIK
jgi:hypothetical protein